MQCKQPRVWLWANKFPDSMTPHKQMVKYKASVHTQSCPDIPQYLQRHSPLWIWMMSWSYHSLCLSHSLHTHTHRDCVLLATSRSIGVISDDKVWRQRGRTSKALEINGVAKQSINHHGLCHSKVLFANISIASMGVSVCLHAIHSFPADVYRWLCT